MIDFKKLLGRSEPPASTELSAEAYALLQQLQQTGAETTVARSAPQLHNPFTAESASAETATASAPSLNPASHAPATPPNPYKRLT